MSAYTLISSTVTSAANVPIRSRAPRRHPRRDAPTAAPPTTGRRAPPATRAPSPSPVAAAEPDRGGRGTAAGVGHAVVVAVVAGGQLGPRALIGVAVDLGALLIDRGRAELLVLHHQRQGQVEVHAPEGAGLHHQVRAVALRDQAELDLHPGLVDRVLVGGGAGQLHGGGRGETRDATGEVHVRD